MLYTSCGSSDGSVLNLPVYKTASSPPTAAIVVLYSTFNANTLMKKEKIPIEICLSRNTIHGLLIELETELL